LAELQLLRSAESTAIFGILIRTISYQTKKFGIKRHWHKYRCNKIAYNCTGM